MPWESFARRMCCRRAPIEANAVREHVGGERAVGEHAAGGFSPRHCHGVTNQPSAGVGLNPISASEYRGFRLHGITSYAHRCRSCVRCADACAGWIPQIFLKFLERFTAFQAQHLQGTGLPGSCAQRFPPARGRRECRYLAKCPNCRDDCLIVDDLQPIMAGAREL